MPVKKCQKEGKPGYKWGDEGFCYTYDTDEEKKRAKEKALDQGRAIKSSEDFNFNTQSIIKVRRGDKDVIEVSDFDIDTTNASLVFRTNTPDRLQKEVPIEEGVAKIVLEKEETMSIKEGEYKYSLAIKTDEMEKTFVVGDFIVQNRI